MAWSGGNFTRIYGNNGWTSDAALGVGIEAGRHDIQDNDLKDGIDQCLNKTGQNSMTGDLNLGGYKAVNAAAGTAGAPAICAGNDVNTGMYSPAADEIGFSIGGTERVRIAGQCIGVNHEPDPNVVLDLTRTGGGQCAVALRAFSTTASLGTNLSFYKSNTLTVDSSVLVNNNDQVANMWFYGANGTGYDACARIVVAIDGTPGASNDMPGRISFNTTPEGSATTVERMRIRSDGNVGIASVGSASARLTIIGEDTGTSNYSLVTYGSSGVSANGLVVRNDGRVGIGTASLNAKTVIAGESTTLPVLRLLGGGAGDVANRAFEIFKTDNDSTTSQNFVYFYINNGSTASGKINANGANAAAFGSTSDIRLKENIVDLPSQLDAILSLRPVEFDYKDGSGHQIGFIAQEVQEVYPDLVGESDGYLTLTDLNKNDARMIKAFQELAAKVEALEAKIQALEAVTEV